MSSACLMVQQPSYGSARWSRPLNVSTIPVTNASLWRPWTLRDSGRGQRSHTASPYSRATLPGCFSSDGKPQSFQHPVRLFWPRSKSFDYLFSDGEILLRNFPVQATISFYEDSSDSDSEEDEEEEEEECVKQSHCTELN